MPVKTEALSLLRKGSVLSACLPYLDTLAVLIKVSDDAKALSQGSIIIETANKASIQIRNILRILSSLDID